MQVKNYILNKYDVDLANIDDMLIAVHTAAVWCICLVHKALNYKQHHAQYQIAKHNPK